MTRLGCLAIRPRRIWPWLLSVAVLVTVALTALQLYQDHRADVSVPEARLGHLEQHAPALLPHLTDGGSGALRQQLEGLRTQIGASYLRLAGQDGRLLADVGQSPLGDGLDRRVPLLSDDGRVLGQLYAWTGLADPYERLPGVLFGEALKVLLLSLLLLILLPGMLNRWLRRLAVAGREAYGEASSEEVAGDGLLALSELMSGMQRRLAGARREAARSRDWFNRLYLDARHPILMLHPDREVILECNAAACRLLGYQNDELNGVPVSRLHPQHMPAFRRFARRVLKDGSGWTAELTCRHRGGHDLVVEVSASLIEHPQGQVILATVRDQSEHREVQAQIELLAYHDSLTGLPNRVLLRDRLEMALARSRRSGKRGPVLFIDVDNFKTVNDSLGHPAGDCLLQEIGVRMSRVLHQEDTVARLGGDEFVVLPEEVGSDKAAVLEQAIGVVEKLSSSLERPFLLDDHDIHVTVSVGVAMYPDDGETVDELLRRAESALYQAKTEGRGATHFYAPELEEGMSRRLTMGTALRRALADGEFVLVFQPQVSLPDRRPVAAEALVRWQRPNHGLVSPAEFLPYVEELGLMGELGFWVLDQTCRCWRQASEQGLITDDFRMSVNVGAQQFLNPAFVQMVRSVLEENRMPAASLELELTEQVLVRDLEDAAAKVSALRELGVSFAIDDFGTGYSSLSYLHRLPVDAVKIDRSFVGLLGQASREAALVDVIVGMGRKLGLRVVAEGVETEAQEAYLTAHGCDMGQGFLFGRPVAWDVLCERRPDTDSQFRD